jgi:TMEM175 potassium channel family protein
VSSRSLSDVGGWEAFLHGVFAIAITLLVLDIRVPTVDEMASGDDLITALAHEWPRYFAYALGFLYIGTYWIASHRTLRMLRGIDHWFIVFGLLFLMVIATVPFVTGLLAEYIGQSNGRDRVALVVFCGWQLVLSLLANLTLRYAAWKGRLLKPGLDQKALTLWLRLSLVGPLVWVVAILSAALVSGTITLVLIAAIVVVFLQEVPLGSGEGIAD